MSDRVAVFNDGQIQQLSTPEGLYENPENAFVAQFIGENNKLVGKVKKANKNEVLVSISKNLEISAMKVNCGEVGSSTTLSIRPERIHLNSKYKNKVTAKVKQLIYHGDHIRCLLELDKNNNFIVKIPNSNIKNPLKAGEKISISWDSKDCHALDA
jgi:putative spermidine/putrescine transport system ATP-binding protein